MSDYTNETFEIIWRFQSVDGDNYVALREKSTEIYQLYLEADVEETSYTNHVVKKNYSILNGIFNELASPCFISVSNNLIHSATAAAAFVPHGLDVFQPKDIVEHYAIYGRLMSQFTWLSWVKDSPTWTQVMANFLGSKNPE